jgi:hypothetical protein
MAKKIDLSAKAADVSDQLDNILEQNKDFDIQDYMSNVDEDMPDLDKLEIYDYAKEIDASLAVGNNIMEALVDLYLGDNKDIKNHSYVKAKMKEDASTYADSLFLIKMTKKNLLCQLKLADQDPSPRIYEIMNQTTAQMRENSKFAASQKTQLEKFWKEIRKDVGMSESVAQDTPSSNDSKKSGGITGDPAQLNEMLDRLTAKRIAESQNDEESK